ncbi:ABC transporter ATP-binding protein [Thiobacter aerophilum]|uniref:ABC transporter ATP-binding protein n=1 Tax=Thiobacter aerophilum TaxID=3121275 RepID=A0ABV0EDB7_9BURK
MSGSPPALEVRAVHKRFGELHALRGVDLTVEAGEFFALLGPNGAGKSTLINIVAGLARATLGSARVMGHDVVRDYRAARRALGVVPQELVFDPFFTVRETLEIQSGYFGLRDNHAWIDALLDGLGLADKADTNMRKLSGGMKRRVLVAQALVHKPPVIILDEPTAGVDVELRQSLWQFIQMLNREGHTVLLTTHYLEEAEALCNRIAMLKQGRIIALDTKQNLLSRFTEKYASFTLREGRLPPELQGKVVASGDRYTLRLNDMAELENLLCLLRTQGAVIADLDLVKPDLEEVFIHLMQSQP